MKTNGKHMRTCTTTGTSSSQLPHCYMTFSRNWKKPANHNIEITTKLYIIICLHHKRWINRNNFTHKTTNHEMRTNANPKLAHASSAKNLVT